MKMFITWCSIMLLSGTSFSQNVGLSTSSPQAKLHIKGTEDVTQLLLDAHSEQTNFNPFLKLRASPGYELLWIDSDNPTNLFIGYKAGFENVVFEDFAIYNTFIGSVAAQHNLSGSNNVAIGSHSLNGNYNGFKNTALGIFALGTGNYNTALGNHALEINQGSYNTGIGWGTLTSTSSSQFNVALGHKAGYDFNNGWNNVFAGYSADVSTSGGYNMVAAGKFTTCTNSSQARIGNISTTSIGGYANWTNISDGRFKNKVTENVSGLEFITKLHPVTYQVDMQAFVDYQKLMLDSIEIVQLQPVLRERETTIHTGFIAQEVEAAAASVHFEFSGIDHPRSQDELYGLRYALFVVPLVKSVQELDQQLENLQLQLIQREEMMSEVEILKKKIQNLTKDAKLK